MVLRFLLSVGRFAGLRLSAAFVSLSAIFPALILIIFALPGSPAMAFTGEKQIILLSADKTETVIGKIRFKTDTDGASFEVTLDASRFSDHFLSMRPFQCIEHVKQTICHLQYPYKTRRHITRKDLTDLEYELLFLHKKKGEYGINAWNGIYYKLSLNSDGTISGVLNEADMNVLASPPAQDYDRPIGEADLTEGEPPQYRFPTLLIR